MKLNVPSHGELKLRPAFIYKGKRYRIPYDVDWMTTYVSEESHGPVLGILTATAAVLLTPFTGGISLLLALIAWNVSKKEKATIEVQFIDGTYFRGFSESPKEIKFAERHTVAPRPIQEQNPDEDQPRPPKASGRPQISVVK